MISNNDPSDGTTADSLWTIIPSFCVGLMLRLCCRDLYIAEGTDLSVGNAAADLLPIAASLFAFPPTHETDARI